MDLTPLAWGIHYSPEGDSNPLHLCLRIQAIQQLKNTLGHLPGDPRIEFRTQSHSNPAKVACNDCWRENLEVQQACGLFTVRKPRRRYVG